MSKFRTSLLVAAAVLAPLGASHAQAPGKRPLDHDAYAVWDTIGAPAISNDGKWALYSLIGYDRDGELRVRSTTGSTEYQIPRAGKASFDRDTRAALFIIEPARANERARKSNEPDTLGILDLRTGKITRIPSVRSFEAPRRAGGLIAYHLAREKDGPAGTTLVIRNLEDGSERQIERVTTYTFAANGKRLAYTALKSAAGPRGAYVLDLGSGRAEPILSGAGAYRSLTWDVAGEQLAFLTTRDDTASRRTELSLYTWRAGSKKARQVAALGSPGIPNDWQISRYRKPVFSRDGKRLFFGTSPIPAPAPADSVDAEDVKVDIWHWRDPDIQPQQLRRLRSTRQENYLAVVHLESGKIVQLADESLPLVTLPAGRTGPYALGRSYQPYEIENNWDTPEQADYYLIDMDTGDRTLTHERIRGRVSFSPTARYLTWFDNETGWMAREISSGKIVEMSAGVPHSLEDEDFDRPMTRAAYGSAGWTAGDREFLVYDDFDIWALDPTGKVEPRNLTRGAGRAAGIRFRLVHLSSRSRPIDLDSPVVLSAFHRRTKDSGFYRTTLGGKAEPSPLVFMDRRFSTPIKAANADVVLYSRSSFQEFPDLWVSGTDFRSPRKITEANPQQAEYLWGSAELVEWTSTEGVELQGVLYKPENFDPKKKYPLISYFYERRSDDLHKHFPIVPHRSAINYTFYTSRGYLVFVPDIVYRTGYPGESAMHSVVPGILKLLETGYVDRDRIGLQGHSWGGYQIAYMVTRTDLFRAAIAGAPVANMTSAYGGIRWASGKSRQFQYERGQSRIGETLWDAPIRYIENSPLFWLDRVDTPLLIMHNDKDGAVPWYQGIELFMGLRRLQKPTWLINYNGEPHWPTTAANKVDWNIRMQQYFDHYLMDKTAPTWMVDGVPAVMKGKTLGREPATTGVASEPQQEKR